MLDTNRITLNQRAALTQLWRNHPDGAVFRLPTVEALVRRGFARQPNAKRPHWIKLTDEGLDWCAGMGW